MSPSAKIHSLAQVEGDVRILGGGYHRPRRFNSLLNQGATFHIGSGTVVQEGCAIYGLPQGKVLGDDQAPYTVWVGDQARLTHKVLIQGPAYIGAGCFVGFRSTLFNARLGKGCIVLMHALVQDVEIPAGKLVPSGSVITRQEQADMLPDVGACRHCPGAGTPGRRKLRNGRTRESCLRLSGNLGRLDKHFKRQRWIRNYGTSTAQP